MADKLEAGRVGGGEEGNGKGERTGWTNFAKGLSAQLLPRNLSKLVPHHVSSTSASASCSASSAP